MIPIPGGARVSIDLVTLEQFVRLLVTEDYFREELWSRLAAHPHGGGDAILRRLDFNPGTAQQPVTGVSWYEADAYCRSAGGRLPSTEELGHVRRQIGARVPEWCDDWYNPKATGRNVFPEPPPRKRVAGWPEADSAAPDVIGCPFAFRVAFDEPVGRERR